MVFAAVQHSVAHARPTCVHYIFYIQAYDGIVLWYAWYICDISGPCFREPFYRAEGTATPQNEEGNVHHPRFQHASPTRSWTACLVSGVFVIFRERKNKHLYYAVCLVYMNGLVLAGRGVFLDPWRAGVARRPP